MTKCRNCFFPINNSVFPIPARSVKRQPDGEFLARGKRTRSFSTAFSTGTDDLALPGQFWGELRKKYLLEVLFGESDKQLIIFAFDIFWVR